MGRHGSLGSRTIAVVLHNKWVRELLAIFTRFNTHGGGLNSAGLAFFAFLSLSPVVLLAIGLWSYFLGGVENAHHFIRGAFSGWLPVQSEDLRRGIETVFENRGTFSLIGFFGLALSATGFLRSAEVGLNMMWGSQGRSDIASRYLVGFGLAGVGLLLGMVSLIGSALSTWATEEIGISVSMRMVAWSSNLVSIWVALYVAYRWLPVEKSNRTSVAKVALVIGVIEEIFKPLFGMYLHHFASYGAIYGPITAVAVTMVYLYILMTLFLLGGAALAEMQSREAMGRPHRKDAKTPQS